MYDRMRRLADALRRVERLRIPSGCTCGECPSTEAIDDLFDAPPAAADADTLLRYVEHVFLTVGSDAGLIYLLPAALREWERDLYRPNGAFNPCLHRALGHEEFLLRLPGNLKRAALAFMRSGLLDRIASEQRLDVDAQDTGCYRWIADVASYGAITDDIPALWDRWWAMDTTGHAVAALQYASCLVCPEEDENPVFWRWTSDQGGGVPDIAETGSLAVGESWRDENISYYQRTITPEFLLERIQVAEGVIDTAQAQFVASALLSRLDNDRIGVIRQIAEATAALRGPVP